VATSRAVTRPTRRSAARCAFTRARRSFSVT